MVSAMDLSLFGPCNLMVAFHVTFWTMFIKYSLNFLANSLKYVTALSPIWRIKIFERQKSFNCIPKLLVSHYSIWNNFRKVVLFCLFVKILTDILLLLTCQKIITRRPFCVPVLRFIIALLSSFVIRGGSLPSYHFLLYWNMFIKNHSKNICKDIILIMLFRHR